MITVRITGLRGNVCQENGIENAVGDRNTYCNFGFSLGIKTHTRFLCWYFCKRFCWHFRKVLSNRLKFKHKQYISCLGTCTQLQRQMKTKWYKNFLLAVEHPPSSTLINSSTINECRGGAWEAHGAQNCNPVQQVTMKTLWAAFTQAPSYC